MKDSSLFKVWNPSSAGFFPMTYHEVRVGDFTRLHRELHTHPEYELILAVREETALMAEGEEIRLSEGDCCLLRAGVRHCFLSVRSDYNILHVEWQGMLFPRCGEWEEYQLTETHLPAVDVYRRDSPGAAHLRACFALAAEKPPYYEMDFRGELFLFAAQRARRYPESTEGIRGKNRDLRLRAVLVLMQEHLAEKITVEKLAQTAGVTPNHFLRLFHAAFDTTPIAYLNRLRLETASRALADTDMPVIDIALAVGYGDVSNFIRAFNKIYGMTPGRFRLRQKKDRRKPARLRLTETPDKAENRNGAPSSVAGKKPDA